MKKSWDDLEKNIINCICCPKLIKSRNKPVLGFGVKNAKIMIVGLAPGKDGADMTGLPFTRDPSGRLLEEMLQAAGFSRELDVYITNLVKCNPQDERGRNRNPSNREIKNCQQYLELEINYVSPRIIIPLGRSAVEFFTRKKVINMLDVHAKEFNWKDKIIFPFIHPGYVIRGAYNRGKYIEEFKKLNNIYIILLESESKLNRMDLLLMLLKNTYIKNNNMIVGKTRLQKFIFLVQDQLIRNGYKSKYAFRPYYYGPFNRQLYTDLEWLKMNDLINIDYEYNNNGYVSKYMITNKGLKDINDKLKNKNYIVIEKILKETIHKYEDYPISKLVDYVHKEYDKYNLKEKKIKNQKLDTYLISKEI